MLLGWDMTDRAGMEARVSTRGRARHNGSSRRSVGPLNRGRPDAEHAPYVQGVRENIEHNPRVKEVGATWRVRLAARLWFHQSVPCAISTRNGRAGRIRASEGETRGCARTAHPPCRTEVD